MSIKTRNVRTIKGLQRLRNSTNGNPRYRVTFTDGTSATTAADHSFVDEMTSGWEGRDVLVAVGGRGTITDLQVVSL